MQNIKSISWTYSSAPLIIPLEEKPPKILPMANKLRDDWTRFKVQKRKKIQTLLGAINNLPWEKKAGLAIAAGLGILTAAYASSQIFVYFFQIGIKINGNEKGEKVHGIKDSFIEALKQDKKIVQPYSLNFFGWEFVKNPTNLLFPLSLFLIYKCMKKKPRNREPFPESTSQPSRPVQNENTNSQHKPTGLAHLSLEQIQQVTNSKKFELPKEFQPQCNPSDLQQNLVQKKGEQADSKIQNLQQITRLEKENENDKIINLLKEKSKIESEINEIEQDIRKNMQEIIEFIDEEKWEKSDQIPPFSDGSLQEKIDLKKFALEKVNGEIEKFSLLR